MKSKFVLLFFIIPFCFKGFSQVNDNVAYAITGQSAANLNWTDIRSIDMPSGNLISTLFDNNATRYSFTDAETGLAARFAVKAPLLLNQKSLTTNLATTGRVPNVSSALTTPAIAAAALDKRHNKLFFAPVHSGQLIWLDLGNRNGFPSFYTIEKQLLEDVDFNNEALSITRMAIGADGNGYALTNDGTHLIRFTTGNKIVISDLGSLIDDESNNQISVHNPCSSWGGDIVADAFGTLYLFTASRNVFLIDPDTRVATFKGSITGLSGTFSVNGAAAIDDENVMVSTANTFEGYYKVDINTFSATKIDTKGLIYNASDLASSVLLHGLEKQRSVGTPTLRNLEVIGNRFVSVYPNPVTDGQIKITFEGNASGTYKISFTDIQGRLIGTKDVFIKGPGQVETFQMRNKQPSGMYLIKITDAASKSIFADKLVVE